MAYNQRKYSDNDKEQAYVVYREVHTLRATAEITEINIANLSRWCRKYKWKERIGAEQKGEIFDPAIADCRTEKLIDTFKMTKEDAEVIRQCKVVERVCLECIGGYTEDKTEEGEERIIKVRPKTFAEAINALHKCWTVREVILHRDSKKPQTFMSEEEKPDIVAETEKGT